jgi:5S rRNA maturation endonuclease (ribonuclease M5)
LNADWSEEIIDNIKNSKKLFILIDHDNSEELRKRVENEMKKYGLNNIELNIICPKYENLTTILNEYQEEQSDFNPEKLSQRIISKL